MSDRVLRAWRLAAVAALPALFSSCGSGAAALFSAADSDSTPPEPFLVRFSDSSPRMFALANAGSVTSTIDAAQNAVDIDSSTPVVVLEFTRLPDSASVQASDFTLTRIDEDNVDLEPVVPMSVRVSTSGVEIELDAALYLNGLYRVDVVGQLVDSLGLALTGPRTAFFQVSSGTFDENEELIAFGAVAAGGLRLGGRNRTFASLEAQVTGSTFFVATNSADLSSVYSSPKLLYQNSGQNFDQLNTSGVQLNGTTALIRAQEGRLLQIHNGNSEDSIRNRAFPGTILQTGADITWPNLVSANQDPGRYLIDRGPEFDFNGTGDNKHISWRPRIHPLNVQQAQNGLGKNVVVWWAWQDENIDTFETYGVYANSLDLDIGFNNEWSDPVLLSDPSDDTVGWPKSTAFGDGTVVAIWHDATTQEELYQSEITRYQGARFNSQTNAWGPSSTFSLAGDLGRIGDVESLAGGDFLVFARDDEDEDLTVGNTASGLLERASVTVRRLGFDSSGNLTGGLGGAAAVVAPGSGDLDSFGNVDDFYSLSLGYESALPSGTGVPAQLQYLQVRNGIDRIIPSASPIDGTNFLVSWEDESPSGEPRLWLSVFDSAAMQWRNGEAIDIIAQLGLTNLQDIFIVGVTVDRLGYANVAWQEGPSNRILSVSMVRTTASILGNGTSTTPLADAFPTNAADALPVTGFVSNNPLDSSDVTAGGIYPASCGLSNVDGSGHVAFYWARLYLESSSSSPVLIGSNGRRFR